MEIAQSKETTVLPFVTFLISTFNRREVLLRTLAELAAVDGRCGFITETIVVDNASTDGTADAVTQQFANVILIREAVNRGACAKNAGLAQAAGRFIVFLDDDSYPTADSMRAMVEHFAADKNLGAAVFDVILPNGNHECSAYPKVFIGCGTGFRREALEAVGGLPNDFFMQAEEYDLSLRLLDGGWDIQRFEDLRVMHLKTPGARVATRTTRLDVRNNLTLIYRYFPLQFRFAFAVVWMRRYWWIARGKGRRHHAAFWLGLAQGIVRAINPGGRKTVSLHVFERFAMMREIQARMTEAARERGIESVLLIDVGKNILPFYLAAKAAGLRIVGIADSRLARRGRTYRGVRVIDDAEARQMIFDAAVVANLSPVHAASRAAEWRRATTRPVIDLFETTEVLTIAA